MVGMIDERQRRRISGAAAVRPPAKGPASRNARMVTVRVKVPMDLLQEVKNRNYMRVVYSKSGLQVKEIFPPCFPPVNPRNV